jgi:hypothetical protein
MVGDAVTAGAVTGWRYFVLANIVQDALTGESPTMAERNVSGVARRPEPGDRTARILHMVRRGASEADVSLLPDEVTVSADANAVTVRVRHVYPVFEHRAHRIEIPITIERSLALP